MSCRQPIHDIVNHARSIIIINMIICLIHCVLKGGGPGGKEGGLVMSKWESNE